MESLALMQAAFKGRQESVETTKERPEGLQDSRRNGLREKLWEIGIRGNICRMIKKMKEFARSAVMVDGEISKCVDILKGVAQGCTLSPNAFKVYMNDMIVAVEAAKRTVTVGEDTVSELMFADDFVGISEMPEGVQNQIDKALEYARKCKVLWNV